MATLIRVCVLCFLEQGKKKLICKTKTKNNKTEILNKKEYLSVSHSIDSNTCDSFIILIKKITSGKTLFVQKNDLSLLGRKMLLLLNEKMASLHRLLRRNNFVSSILFFVAVLVLLLFWLQTTLYELEGEEIEEIFIDPEMYFFCNESKVRLSKQVIILHTF